MFRVTYTHFGRYPKERVFDCEKKARGFFYGYCVRTKGITKAELRVIGSN